MYRLSKTVTFDAAHFLPGHEGKCKELHGHSWGVRIEARIDDDESLGESGMVADFGHIKQIVQELDHKSLNTIEPFSHSGTPPTAENIAKYLAEKVLERWPDRFDFVCVTVSESDGAVIDYIPSLD